MYKKELQKEIENKIGGLDDRLNYTIETLYELKSGLDKISYLHYLSNKEEKPTPPAF